MDRSSGHPVALLAALFQPQPDGCARLARLLCRANDFPGKYIHSTIYPTVLAFMPQTAFYSLGNDMLSAVCFGATFICLLKWLSFGNPSLLLGAATGLAFMATFLTKMTNLPLLAIAAVVLLFKARTITQT